MTLVVVYIVCFENALHSRVMLHRGLLTYPKAVFFSGNRLAWKKIRLVFRLAVKAREQTFAA